MALIAACFCSGGGTLCAQEQIPSNPLRRTTTQSQAADANLQSETDDIQPLEPRQFPGAVPRSVLAREQQGRQLRQFSQHDVWGEDAELIDPQVQPALAIAGLPSPAATIGVAYDDLLTSGEMPPGSLGDPAAVAPRIGFSPQQSAAPETAWPIDAKLPHGTQYSPEGLALWQRWQQPWRWHTDPDDPQRHIGLGDPLSGTSWRNRPWFAGAFFGGAFHGDLTGNVRQNNGSLMGLRLGWDLDHYYGIEARYAFSNPQIMDSAGNSLGDSHDYILDVSALYYPLGDARWRPYFGLGLGMATYRFRDENDERIHDSAVSLPISVGVKYFYSPHFTIRLDAVDNVTFGSDNLDAMNNFFLLGSVEYRFGGRRPSYFPWHGGTAW